MSPLIFQGHDAKTTQIFGLRSAMSSNPAAKLSGYLRLLQLLVQSAQRNFYICVEQPESELVGGIFSVSGFVSHKSDQLLLSDFYFQMCKI